MSDLKGINIENVKQEEEFIPTEEWYYYAFVKHFDYWEILPNIGKDPRNKQNAIDEAKRWSASQVKIIKLAMPMFEAETSE